MIVIKNDKQIQVMRESGKVNAHILEELKNIIEPGISTMDIDNFASREIEKYGMTASFLGYNGYPASVCTSVNEVVVHGIPSKSKMLLEGDIIGIDLGVTYKGFISDAARTYFVGQVSKKAQEIVKVAEEAFFRGIEKCRVGYKISDISAEIQKFVENRSYSVIRDLFGHGVGENMHEDPQIPNFGIAGRGARIENGMTLAIEPMIAEGTYEINRGADNWTESTKDGKLSAHYENTVAIVNGEPEIITLA
ncbi:MAG: type I methionyl aminopeptidase [Anaerovoracaceae bacterium]